MAGPANPTWKQFFDSHAPRYLDNPFTKWTTSEVSFIEHLFALKPGMSILDLGCGVGRHAIEFAKRGYRVTGVDISDGMIGQAQRAADEASVDVKWIVADAKLYRTQEPHDVVICLCEGGLGLTDVDKDPIANDFEILRSAYVALKPGGHFIATMMNGYATIRQMTDEAIDAGAFDPATMVSHYMETWDLPEGKSQFEIRERLFIPPEMVAMLRHLGFNVLHVWGGTAGEWGQRPVKLDEIEAMYVCQKPEANA